MGVKVREKDPGSGVYYVYISHRGQRKAKRIGDKKERKGDRQIILDRPFLLVVF